MLYCAKFYGRGFGRVYEPKTLVMKLCTVQHYPIIICESNKNANEFKLYKRESLVYLY